MGTCPHLATKMRTRAELLRKSQFLLSRLGVFEVGRGDVRTFEVIYGLGARLYMSKDRRFVILLNDCH